jgi:hypothetical protein
MGLLDHDTLVGLLEELNEGLRRREVRADVYVFGGAAMILAYGADRATRDIDAKFEPHGPVMEEAQVVARRHGLPGSWLNDQATVYLSTRHDAGAAPVFDRSHLRVQAASPEHMVALKVLAARPDDLRNLALLVDRLDLTGLDEVRAIVEAFFPQVEVPGPAWLAVEDVLAGRSDPPR